MFDDLWNHIGGSTTVNDTLQFLNTGIVNGKHWETQNYQKTMLQ